MLFAYFIRNKTNVLTGRNDLCVPVITKKWFSAKTIYFHGHSKLSKNGKVFPHREIDGIVWSALLAKKQQVPPKLFQCKLGFCLAKRYCLESRVLKNLEATFVIVSTRSNLLFGPTIWTIDKIVRFYELDNLSLIIRSTRKRQLLDIEIPFIGEV